MNTQHNYNFLDEYLKNRFGKKVFKVALNGNFSCPNRDGKISKGGCIFCSPLGSGEFAGKKEEKLAMQFEEIKNIISLKWPDALYIVYFQANTNTYAPLSKLKELFEEAITLDKGIVAISIATRPDSISNETLNYLEELNKRIPVFIELGLQTIHDETARIINRGYETSKFYEIVKELRKRNIEVIVHLINGLPKENKEMMVESAKAISKLDIQGIKLHSLCILKGTVCEEMYNKKELEPLTLDEYVDIVTEQLKWIRKDIIIHRVGADAPLDLLIEPMWTRKKFVVMNEIDKKMKKDGIVQGQNC